MIKYNNSPIRRLALTGMGAALAAFATIHVATASPVETDQTQVSGGYTIPTANDLILNATPVLSVGSPTAAGNDYSSGSLAGLTNGVYNTDTTGGAAVGGNAAGFGGAGLQSVVFNLGSNATGYNLTSIDTYAGWGDGGRITQAYSVFYSTVSAPSTFNLLDTVNYNGFGGNQDHVALTDTTGIVASNVADIEFVFNPTANNNNYSVFQELSATGTAAPSVTAVPEPTTWAMMFSGLGILIFTMRRRSKVS